MKYLLILFLFSCTTKLDYPELPKLNYSQFALNTRSTIWTDTIWWDAFTGPQWNGEWLDFDYGKIADQKTKDSELVYVFTGVGIDVYTYVDGHHIGYNVSFDGVESYIDLNFEPREVRKTFSISGLRNIKHTLVITPNPSGTFVFVKFVKFVAFKPDWIDDPCDCTEINYIDSIRYVVKDSTIFNYRDSIVYKVNYIDSIRWTMKDTTVVNYRDSIKWIINYKDSTRIHYDTANLEIWLNADSLIFKLK